MRRLWGIALALSVAIVIGLAAPAAAQSGKFEELASQAVKVPGPRAFAGLLWSYVAACEGTAGSMARRQCEGLRKARQTQLAGKTFLVPADAAAFSAGEWDETKRSAPLILTSCVVCSSGLAIDGRQLFVVGNSGIPTVSGGVVHAARIHESALPFKDATALGKWKDDVVPRLRTEMIVRVADGGKLWKQGDASGFNVELLGFRVYDPCDGGIVFASPESTGGTADKKACSGEAVVEDTGPKPEVPVGPVTPKLPTKLTTAQIQTALRPATAAAQLCFENYGVAGTADFHITIDASGNVIGVEQEGDFVDMPTGKCIEKAVRASKFPETAKKRTTVQYPFILR
jgi:hypothetical protein